MNASTDDSEHDEQAVTLANGARVCIIPEWRLIKLDESEGWDKELLQLAGRIYTVYLYNKRSHTYCCELTPSYWLTPLYITWDNAVSESQWEPFQARFGEQEFDVAMQGGFCAEGIYVHVAEIDRLETKDPQFSQPAHLKPDEYETQEAMEDAILEYEDSNRAF